MLGQSVAIHGHATTSDVRNTNALYCYLELFHGMGFTGVDHIHTYIHTYIQLHICISTYIRHGSCGLVGTTCTLWPSKDTSSAEKLEASARLRAS